MAAVMRPELVHGLVGRSNAVNALADILPEGVIMAYRATSKKAVKKSAEIKNDDSALENIVVKSAPPVLPATPVQSGSVSVEDLVGAPVDKQLSRTEKTSSTETIITQNTDKVSPKPEIIPGPVPYDQTPVPFRMGGRDRYHRGPRRDYGGYQRRDLNSQPPQYAPDIDVPTETVRGILDIMPEGHGFLRPKFTPSDRDVYISQSQIRRFLLRNGDMVEGQARSPKDNERYYGLLKVEKVNEQAAEGIATRKKFEDLVPIYPNMLLRLETGEKPLSTRMIDLVAPIGFGQRGLIVSPPKAGKTTILKEIAAGVAANYPNVHLMAALIGERPEEVTDISRSVKGEVLASNFDESPAEQTRIAEVALDRAKRLVEMGKDVVILLDSITRLARAYNLVVNPSGRTLSGGFDPAALYPAKRFLGAARCVEAQNPEEGTSSQDSGATTGGSLTVIGTALIDTGSRMDDLIYEEFKGTGNMELHLSRNLQERRIFPAIDVEKSGTRHDELLIGEEPMKRVTTLRHMLSLLSAEERTMMMTDRLGKTKSNSEFLDTLSTG
jgi:transcription termination factor Rho